jgi:chromosomal replication initiator protein
MEKVWREVVVALKKRIPAHSFRMWIDPLAGDGDEEGRWTITCPNAFSRKRVQEHFGELIQAELRRILGDPNCHISLRRPAAARANLEATPVNLRCWGRTSA